jgi:hypothetical protein
VQAIMTSRKTKEGGIAVARVRTQRKVSHSDLALVSVAMIYVQLVKRT